MGLAYRLLYMLKPNQIEASTAELIAHWREKPAPLLGLLHTLHDRDGYLSDESLRTVSEGLPIPLADLYATVTFYHHFARTPPGQSTPRVCTGPICCQRGARDVLQALDEAREMPCAGRCDHPIPVLVGQQVFTATPDATLTPIPSPLPPINPSAYG